MNKVLTPYRWVLIGEIVISGDKKLKIGYKSTFNQLTNTIEQKTTTDAHPGIITQMSNAVHKGLDKVEELLNEVSTLLRMLFHRCMSILY